MALTPSLPPWGFSPKELSVVWTGLGRGRGRRWLLGAVLCKPVLLLRGAK